MIRKDAWKPRYCYDLYIALIEQCLRYLHLGCYSEHQRASDIVSKLHDPWTNHDHIQLRVSE
jgi:hypothetical protein